jgi:hypothetical protein
MRQSRTIGGIVDIIVEIANGRGQIDSCAVLLARATCNIILIN